MFTSSVHSVGELLPLLGIPSLDPYRTILIFLLYHISQQFLKLQKELLSLIVKAEKI